MPDTCLIGVVAGTARGVDGDAVYLFIYAFMQLGAFTVIVMMRRETSLATS